MSDRPAPTSECRPILVVHDEIVIERPIHDADEARQWLEGCMVDGLSKYISKVPIAVESEI